jgi:hypothetical protein
MAEPDPDHRISSWIAFDLLGEAFSVLETVDKLSAENEVFRKSD